MLTEYDGEPVASPTREHIYGASGMLATVEADKINYHTPDNLGSPRVLTDGSGTITSRRDFLPFGDQLSDSLGNRSSIPGYSVTDSIKQRFTSYFRDDESGLDFAKARYYANNNGRFISADPIQFTNKRLIDPQQINLYAYGRNNPLLFTDPTGTDVYLHNSTQEGRYKALYSATKNLTTEEQKNIAYRQNVKGKYELFIRDPNKINANNASPGYKLLTNLINNKDLKINFTLVPKNGSESTLDGGKVTYKELVDPKTGDIGRTDEYSDGSIQVIVPEGGDPNGVKGLTASGKDTTITFPEYIVTAHELFGETLKYTPQFKYLQNLPRFEEGKKVIGVENTIRAFHGLHYRSGKDHAVVQDGVKPHKRHNIPIEMIMKC